MSNSRYTNLVLTVIALALTIIAIENLARPSRAAAALQPVAICDVDGHVASTSNGTWLAALSTSNRDETGNGEGLKRQHFSAARFVTERRRARDYCTSELIASRQAVRG